jgi:hypothetical protein
MSLSEISHWAKIRPIWSPCLSPEAAFLFPVAKKTMSKASFSVSDVRGSLAV